MQVPTAIEPGLELVVTATMAAARGLLFWLSLVPFGTAWLGRNPRAVGPTVRWSASTVSMRHSPRPSQWT